MAFFLDSNVIIGYQFADTHRLGNPAYAVLHSGEECWWSRQVKYECYGDTDAGGVCGRESYKARAEFRRLNAAILRGTYNPDDHTTYPYLGEIVAAHREKTPCTQDELRQWLREYKQNFVQQISSREKYLRENLRLHIRETEYPDIKKRIIGEIRIQGIELDVSDVEIWLDAHDLAVKMTEISFTFISDNTRHVSAAADIICSCTRIEKIRELEEFRTR